MHAVILNYHIVLAFNVFFRIKLNFVTFNTKITQIDIQTNFLKNVDLKVKRVVKNDKCQNTITRLKKKLDSIIDALQGKYKQSVNIHYLSSTSHDHRTRRNPRDGERCD